MIATLSDYATGRCHALITVLGNHELPIELRKLARRLLIDNLNELDVETYGSDIPF